MEEEIIYQGKLPFRVTYFSHKGLWYLLWGWNIGILTSWLQTFGQMLKITTQRIAITSGFFSQDIEEVEYYRVYDTSYHQSFLDRIVGIGSITIFSRDKTAPMFSFMIHEPNYFREQIRRCIKFERRRMRSVQFD